MTALRWTRRSLDTLIVATLLVVALAAGITLLAPVLGGRALVIGGGSMEPSIHLGSLVLVLPAPDADYAVGDVVTVGQSGATPYTHRVTRLAEEGGVAYVETKGDANPTADPAIVARSSIVGRVVLAVPLLGVLTTVLGSPLGLAGFLATGAALVLLLWLLEDLEEESEESRSARVITARGDSVPAPTDLAARAVQADPGPRCRVREGGRARNPDTPVVLESARRDPRRREVPMATTPAGRPA